MPDSTPFRFPEGSHSAGWLRYLNGLPVLSVAGAPAEIGAAVGALAVRAAPRMTAYPDDHLHHFRAVWLRRPLLWACERMIRGLSPDRLVEMDAMLASSGIERGRLVMGNTLFDIKKLVACSAMLIDSSRSASAAPMLGRNLDYPTRGYAQEYGLVTVYRPAGKRAFVSVGFPGLLGCLSGMNESGLSLAVLEVFQARLFTRRLNLRGTPYAICFRTLLEECDTVEQALTRLNGMRRTTMFNLAVADRRRVAVFEGTTRRVRERGPESGTALCTNHFCLRENRPRFPLNVYTTLERHAVLRREERRRERFGVSELHEALHAASQHDTLQTMVFEPASLRLHLAQGQLPASAGPLRTLELAPLFRGE